MRNKKIVLVTGANRGLGLETAKELAQKGFKVFMGVRNLEKSKDSWQELVNKGLDVELIKLDVTSDGDIAAAVEALKKSDSIPDVLINNAGVFLESDTGGVSGFASVLKSAPEKVLKTFEVNTLAPLKLVQAFAPLMLELTDPRIINVSSGMGQLSDMDGGYPGYRMSKTALNALTRMVASELGGRLKINSLCPGWVKTDMGGPNATRTLEEGVQTAIWLATTKDCPNGGFFRDKKSIDW